MVTANTTDTIAALACAKIRRIGIRRSFYLILIYAHDGDSDLIRVIIVNIQCLYMFNDDITRRLPLYVLDSTVIDVFLEEPYLPSRGATNPLID